MPHSQNRINGRQWQNVLGLIFQGAIAIGTLTLGGLAIWGIFFTDLPETLIRQLRTDVADAQEQLADLRWQRRRLGDEIDATKRQLVQTERRQEQAFSEVQVLEAGRLTLQRQIDQLDSERREYFQRILEIYISAFLQNIKIDLRELHDRVAMVGDLDVVSEWTENRKRTEPKLKKPIRKNEYEQWSKWHDEWRDKVPKTWEEHLAIQMLRGVMSHDDIIQQFRNGVTNASRSSLANASKIITRHAKGEQLSLFLESDRARVLNEIDRFVDAYSDIMALPLDVSLPKGWNARMIPAIVSPILKAHRRVGRLLPELQRRLELLASSSD